jgi:hypothetical protein
MHEMKAELSDIVARRRHLRQERTLAVSLIMQLVSICNMVLFMVCVM